MRTATLLLMASLFVCALSCKQVERPEHMTSTQILAMQAIDATENQISQWIGITRYHSQRSSHAGLQDIYDNMLSISKASDNAIDGINSGKLSFRKDSLSLIKRNIIRSQTYSNESRRYWRDSMVYSFDTLPVFSCKEEAILSIKLLELMMIRDLGRSYTVCTEYEDAPLFWIDDHTVVAILGSKAINMFTKLDTIHIISGWIANNPLTPEQYHVQISGNYCLITIAVPNDYKQPFIEAGFEYVFNAEDRAYSRRYYASFVGYKEK